MSESGNNNSEYNDDWKLGQELRKKEPYMRYIKCYQCTYYISTNFVEYK